MPELPPGYLAPLDGFLPATVQFGLAKPYERVSAAELPDCADPSVPGRERELVRKSGHCTALQVAVYGDADNRYTFWVFTVRSEREASALLDTMAGPTEAEMEDYPANYHPGGRCSGTGRTVWLWKATTALDPAKPGDQNRLENLLQDLMNRWGDQAWAARQARLASEPPLA
ncbi:hypothetical protein ACFQ2M_40830 [Kitasatospora saccharophila]|uniref:hypothetical protein n=1 Tax=Kitasatospora saccharophila TaxID=407973 RepID=UPI0036303786